MAVTITLTDKQIKEVMAGAHKKIEPLTKEEIEKIAGKLAEKVGNAPFFGDKEQKYFFTFVVEKLDDFLYNELPNEIYGYMRDPEKGLSDEAADKLSESLAEIISKSGVIPVPPFLIEGSIEFALGIFIDLLRQHNSVDTLA
jgi:hypothetical protein